MRPGKCRSCGAPVLWVVMAPSGKWNPLDEAPRADGNVIEEGGRARIATAEDQGSVRYASHFATCPNAGQHRRR